MIIFENIFINCKFEIPVGSALL